MKQDTGNRIWLARMPKLGHDNAAVLHANKATILVEWTHGGARTVGVINRRLARLLAKRINEALDFRI